MPVYDSNYANVKNSGKPFGPERLVPMTFHHLPRLSPHNLAERTDIWDQRLSISMGMREWDTGRMTIHRSVTVSMALRTIVSQTILRRCHIPAWNMNFLAITLPIISPIARPNIHITFLRFMTLEMGRGRRPLLRVRLLEVTPALLPVATTPLTLPISLSLRA